MWRGVRGFKGSVIGRVDDVIVWGWPCAPAALDPKGSLTLRVAHVMEPQRRSSIAGG